MTTDKKYSFEDENYRVEITNTFRKRKFISYLPFIKGEFCWFKKVKVLERKSLVQYRLFDDGWTYQYYWNTPKEEWDIVKLLKKY